MSELQNAHGEMESEVERRMLDLMQSESRMRFILNAAGMGVWTLDLKSQRLVASRHCKANFGREGDEPFSYADLQEAIVPEDRDRWRETVDAAIASGDEFDVEYRIRTRSGETRWVEVRGQVSSDITDRATGMLSLIHI